MEDTTTATNRKSKTATKPTAVKTSKSTTKAASGKTPTSATGTSRSKSASSARTRLKGDNISNEQRNRMIETAAYFIAERNGFCSNPVEDWLTAENLIDKQLGHSASV